MCNEDGRTNNTAALTNKSQAYAIFTYPVLLLYMFYRVCVAIAFMYD